MHKSWLQQPHLIAKVLAKIVGVRCKQGSRGVAGGAGVGWRSGSEWGKLCTEHGVSPKGNVTCPNQRQSASQNYDAHTRTHSGTRPLRRSGVLQHTEILSAAKWPTLGYLSTHPVIQFVPAFVHSLGQRPNPHTHTHTNTNTHAHTSWRGHKPEAAFFARSGAPKSVNRQFQLFYRLRSACQMAGAKCQYHQPVLALPGFFPLLPLSLPAHEITKSSAVGGQGCRNMSHEWTEGNGADHCDW